MNIYNSVVMARWVAESARPFQVIADHRYQWLQHAGCPEHYIPSQETVGRDVKALFNKTKETIAEELQVSNLDNNKNFCILTADVRNMMVKLLSCWTRGHPLIIAHS